MKVVIGIDSFKGSMTSMEAGRSAKNGVLRSVPDAEVVVLPLADGGEGTVDALIEGLGADRIDIEVSDPLGRRTSCTYGILPDGTAVMEMAQAAGLTKLSEQERNPFVTSTYGVGEMIVDAIERGCRDFIIGIGGSATNDGGIGMLSALGYEFIDKEGNQVKEGAQGLCKVEKIKDQQVLPKLHECRFRIACDVDNPLCGKLGATYVYGIQKGLDTELCQSVDAGMLRYSQVAERYVHSLQINDKPATNTLEVNQKVKQYSTYPGAGAAGGLGFAFLAFLNGSLESGVDLILDAIGVDGELADADIVLTGEGRMDAQSVYGKAPVGIARRAKKHGCKVFVFAGCLGANVEQCDIKEIDEIHVISDDSIPLEQRMNRENAMKNMEYKVADVFDKG